VHFGTIMLVNFGIGFCHLPVGATLFVGCAVGRVRMEEVMKQIWPFYACNVLGFDAGDLHLSDLVVIAAPVETLARQFSTT
jgi:Tripartite ATP-independent periplasmic transporter, DctM component